VDHSRSLYGVPSVAGPGSWAQPTDAGLMEVGVREVNAIEVDLVDLAGVPVPANEIVVGEPDHGIRSGETARRAPPASRGRASSRLLFARGLRSAAKMHLPPAARAAASVTRPGKARPHPPHVRSRGRGPDHEGVVRIGDNHRPWLERSAGSPPALGDLPDLVVAVQLVTAQIEQDNGCWLDLPRHQTEPSLVDLEHCSGARSPTSQRRGEPRRQVGTRRIGYHLLTTCRRQRSGQQFGCRGLAVGARYKHDPPASGETRQCLGFQCQDDVPTDNRPAATTSHPRQGSNAGACEGRKVRSRGQLDGRRHPAASLGGLHRPKLWPGWHRSL
jgi:hypothetical protein